MRFITRAIGGAAMALLCLALIALGGRGYLACAPGVGPIFGAVLGAECLLAENERRRQRDGPTEREFAVKTARVTLETIAPVTLAYGEIVSGRTLELRAAVAGRLVSVAENFREGAHVRAGQTLFNIDPADPMMRAADAAAAVAEADAELGEAREALRLAEAELQAAIGQRGLRASALERRRGLETRGFSTQAEVEEAELALAEAERAVITRDQARAGALRREAQAAQQLRRAQLALEDADRELADAVSTAPFDGILQGVEAATLGRLVAINEPLGALIDPAALEAAFRAPDPIFARFLDAEGRLAPLALEARLDLGARTVSVPGRLERVGAVTSAEEGGRRVFAALDAPPGSILRPGDFVEIRVFEPPMENVAALPATALDAEERILLLDADGRLAAQPVRLLRRDEDRVVVAGAPDGAAYVVERAPQLAPGVLARPASPPAEGPSLGPETGPEAGADAPRGRDGAKDALRSHGDGRLRQARAADPAASR